MTTPRAFLALVAALAAFVAGAVGLTARPDGVQPVRPSGGRGVDTPRRPVDPTVPAPVTQVVAPGPPVLLVRTADNEPSAPLVLERVKYAVTVTGLAARTRTTLVFRNDLDRTLEGELVFPLPEGALVAGYSLDVNGRQVDGVVVEAARARVAFEAETRKRVDPGLVEWVRGNNFRTRVWPIPARGRRTVEVEYLSDLVVRDHAGRRDAIYELPLRFPAPVEALALKIEVVRGRVAPEVTSGLESIAFVRWQDRYVAETTREHVQPGDDLRVALPDVPRDSVVVETGARGETFFAIDEAVDPPVAAAPLRPARIAVVWDASLSRKDADRERDLRLLAAHLAALGDVEVQVTVVRDVLEPMRSFAVSRGKADAIVAYLREQPCDGGTNLAALRLREDVAYGLLFSDGLSTVGGRTDGPVVRPVYALSGDPRADHGRLRLLAERSGGAYFNLQRHADAEILARLGRPVYSLLGVDADPASVADLQPAGAQAAVGRHVRVTGRLIAPEAAIVLRFGVPGQAATESRTVTVRRRANEATGLVEQLWAQQRVAALSADAEINRAELVRLGQRFSIVTPGTSLLVLETLAQYLEHDVTPPATLPEMREAFLAQRREAAQTAQGKRTGKVEQMVALWQQRVAWWQGTYERRPKPVGREIAADAPPPAPAERGRRENAAPARSAVGAFRQAGSAPSAPTAQMAVPASEAMREAPAVSDASTAAPGADAKVLGDRSTDGDSGGRIVIQAWNPDTPYLRLIERAGQAQAYRVYLAERETYGASPAFFLDCADLFVRQGRRDLGMRVLTNVAELRLEDARLLRVLAHRLEQLDALDLAVELFAQVRRLRPEEPQSLRDLALALDRRASARGSDAGRIADSGRDDARRALALFAEIVETDWDGRFPEIEAIALMEANRLASRLERGGHPADWPLDPRLRGLLDVDLRIVLTWDTDQTDMDLWVVEPGGEKCFYSHPLTSAGGRMSRDFTGGYGPEEYMVRRALAGDYAVKANFFGSQSQSLTGPTMVQATVIADYGRATERRRAITVRLDQAREVVEIGRVAFKTIEGTRD